MTSTGWTFAGKVVYDTPRLREQLKNRGWDATAELDAANSWTYSRGRNSSVGKLLMVQADLAAIANRQQPAHRLAITTDGVSLTWDNLCVIRTQAVFTRIDDQEASPRQPYLVTIGDARHYARHAVADKQFNYRAANSQRVVSTGDLDGRELLQAMWEPLLPVMGPLRISGTPAKLESISTWCVSAWDALWEVLDLMGYSLRLLHDGSAHAYPLEDKPIGNAPTTAMFDGEMWMDRPSLPKTIVGCCQLRDYQWQKDDEAETPADYHRLDPTYTRTFETADLLQQRNQPSIERLDTLEVVPATIGTDSVWGTVPLITDDRQRAVNESQVVSHLRTLAERHAVRLLSYSRRTSWTFMGARRLNVRSRWGSVIYRDTGGGLRTTLSSCEVAPTGGKWEVSRQIVAGPPELHDRQPYSRQAWCRVLAPFGDDVPSAEQESGEIRPDYLMKVELLYGRLAGDRVVWTGSRVVVAVNAGGETLRIGDRVFAEWNYQLSAGGLWCTTGGGISEESPDYPDGGSHAWRQLCEASGHDVQIIRSPSLVTVNRSSMLRMFGTSNRSEVGIELQQGPGDSVLATKGDLVWWTQCPRVVNQELYGWLKLLKGQEQSSASGTGESWVGPPIDGEIRAILPRSAARSHQYMIAEATGPLNTTKLGWFGPGIDCKIITQEWDVTGFLDYLCDYMTSCVNTGSPLPEGVSWSVFTKEYDFSNGLLVEGPGCSVPPFKRIAAAQDVDAIEYNPCHDSDKGGDDDDPPSAGPPITPNPSGGPGTGDDPCPDPMGNLINPRGPCEDGPPLPVVDDVDDIS